MDRCVHIEVRVTRRASGYSPELWLAITAKVEGYEKETRVRVHRLLDRGTGVCEMIDDAGLEAIRRCPRSGKFWYAVEVTDSEWSKESRGLVCELKDDLAVFLD